MTGASRHTCPHCGSRGLLQREVVRLTRMQPCSGPCLCHDVHLRRMSECRVALGLQRGEIRNDLERAVRLLAATYAAELRGLGIRNGVNLEICRERALAYLDLFMSMEDDDDAQTKSSR